jgi:hypothetical protein
MGRENIKLSDSKIESIDGWHGGRSLRSTEEVPVMGMEGREAVIWLLVINEN